MTKNLRTLSGAAFGIVAAVSFSSCAYDPYYGGTSVGAAYSTGGRTSAYISTGNPAWGYDPYSYSYYHYGSRRYYDPYLYGFYPVGYRPIGVYGVPHPYGWRPGIGIIRPPGYVNNHYLNNYHDRVGAYRNSGFGWARQVRPGGSHANDNHSSGRTNPDAKLNNNARPPGSNQNANKQSARGNSGAVPNSNPGRNVRQGGNSKVKSTQGSLPAQYNTPVKTPPQRQPQAQKPANQTGKGKNDARYEEDQKRRN